MPNSRFCWRCDQELKNRERRAKVKKILDGLKQALAGK